MTKLKRTSFVCNVHPAILEQIDIFAKELGLSRNKLLENMMLKEITNSKACPERLKQAFSARVRLMLEGL